MAQYSFSIDDTSPQISYSPPTIPGAIDLDVGWNQLFEDGTVAYPGQQGRGLSLHITAQDNAGLSIPFTGTGIQLFGLAQDSSYTITLDGVASNSSTYTPTTAEAPAIPPIQTDPTEAVLASFSSLSPSDHILTLTTHIEGIESRVIFDRAVVTVSANATNASVSTTSLADTALQFTGEWTFETDADLIPDGAHSYHITQNQGDLVALSFRGTAIQLDGLLNATSGAYNVTLASSPASINFFTILQQQQFTAFSPFLTNSTLFYASGLDPDLIYRLSVTNMEDKSLAVDSVKITSTDVTSVNSSTMTTPSPSEIPPASMASVRYPPGIYAAIAVAAFLAFILIVVLLGFFLWRHRQRAMQRRNLDAQTFHYPRDVLEIAPRHVAYGYYGFGVEGRDAEDHGYKHGYALGDLENAPPPLPAPEKGQDASREARRPRRTLPQLPTRGNTYLHDQQGAIATDLLPRPQTSPFDIEFPKDVDLFRETQDIVDLPILPLQTPSPAPRSLKLRERDTVISFLDFASSAASSIRAVSRPRTPRRPSRPSSQTSRISLPPSSQSQSQSRRSSAGMPLSITVDLTHLRPGAGLAITTSELSIQHPYARPSSHAASPTESIPLTVSDIAFRTADEHSDPDWRASSSHLPPHPALPGSVGLIPASPIALGHGRTPSGVSILPGIEARPSYIAQMLQERRLAHAQAARERARAEAPIIPVEPPSAGSEPSSWAGYRTKLGFIGFGKKS